MGGEALQSATGTTRTGIWSKQCSGRNNLSAVPALRPPPRLVQRIELQSVTIPSQLAKLVLAAPLLFQRIKQVAKSGAMVVGDRDRYQIIDDITIPLLAGPLTSEKKPLIVFRRDEILATCDISGAPLPPSCSRRAQEGERKARSFSSGLGGDLQPEWPPPIGLASDPRRISSRVSSRSSAVS
jgi:hypothetical protein